jgi:hypothetical protein
MVEDIAVQLQMMGGPARWHLHNCGARDIHHLRYEEKLTLVYMATMYTKVSGPSTIQAQLVCLA